MANVSGEEHVFRRESLQGTTTVTFRSRRYHLPSVIVNQPHQLESSAQGPHEECLLLNVGLYCPYCASKVHMSSKHQRLAVTSDGQGGFITQPVSSHQQSGHPHHAFHSLPYDQVQQHLQEQHRLHSAAQGPHHDGEDSRQEPLPHGSDPNVFPGHHEGKTPQYIKELRYRPQAKQTQSLPNRNMGLEYGFIEQHEGTFSFEDHKRKPHQRSRLKDLHTDSLKLQKRRQKLKPSDMGIHGDGAIPEVQSPTSSQSDSKPGTPDEALVPVPVVGFENPNFDYASAENNRRYREQQMKQKLLQRQELMIKQAAMQQAKLQQQQQQQQQLSLQHQQQQQRQLKPQQNQEQPRKTPQGEVFVNKHALDFESAKKKIKHETEDPVPANGQRFFDDVTQQQRYWKQQEELMLQKEQMKHQDIYRRQQEMMYRKQQEKLYRQQQKQRKAQELQLQFQPDYEPQRYNNLDKQPVPEQDIQHQQEQLIKAEQIRKQQEERMRQYQFALQQQHLQRKKKQQQLKQQLKLQQQQQMMIPFHAPESLEDFVEDQQVHHHYPIEQEMTSEKNIQVDNLPMEFLQQKQRHQENGKREHKHREKHSRKRHKKHRSTDPGKMYKSKSTSAVPDEYELVILEPNEIGEEEVREINMPQEQTKVEEIPDESREYAENLDSEQTRMEKLKREHKQNTAYYKEWNKPTEEQSFAHYATARMLFNRCVQEMKGLHETETIDFVEDQTRVVSQIRMDRRDSYRSDSSSTAPARSETSEASTSDLRQTKGGIFFAHVQHRGSVDSAEPVESPPASLELRSFASTLNSGESHCESPELFPANIKYDATNQQHILSISAEGAIAGESSPPATFEEVDDSLEKYMEWLQTEEVRQKKLSARSSSTDEEKLKDEGKLRDEENVLQPGAEKEIEAVPEEKQEDIALHIEEDKASKRLSYQETHEDVVEVEKWDSNGTTYSVYLVTKKPDEDSSHDDDLDINSEVIAMLDHSMESIDSDGVLVDAEEKQKSSSSLDIPTIHEPVGKNENGVKFYISSSNEFLEESETKSMGSYRISEEELLDLEYRVPTILDENENSLFQSQAPRGDKGSGSLLQVPPSAMNIESSDADDGDVQVDDSAEEKEFERIMSTEDMFDSTSEDEEMPRNQSFDIEEEVDDILENIEVETYSPTSTLSRAFTHPRKKKTPRMLRHVQPPEMVPIPSAESNSEMTSSTSSNQEMLHSLDIQATQYQQLAGECASSDDNDVVVEKIAAKPNTTDNQESLAESETNKNLEDDTEDEQAANPAASPEDAFEIVVEAASEEGYGSDWPSDHDEFLPRVIKGKGKKTSDMFIYDFYHEKLGQKQTSSCECLADGASVGRISDIGSDDLERSINDEKEEPDTNQFIEKRTNEELLNVPRADQLMTSSMTSSNISDTSSLEQIIDDTMQLTERILTSCEKIENKTINATEKEKNEDTEEMEQEIVEETEEVKDKNEGRVTEEIKENNDHEDSTEVQKATEPELMLPVVRQDSEIKELEKDSEDVEEMFRWSQENLHKQQEEQEEDTEETTSEANPEHDEDKEDIIDDNASKRKDLTLDDKVSNSSLDLSTAVVAEMKEEDNIQWSQDTVRKSSFDSLDIAEIIHVIDDIPEDDIYDTNEEERVLSDKETEQKDEELKPMPRSQSPVMSDGEVVLDTMVPVVEENFYVSSVDKLEEETRCFKTKSIDHNDMYMESESNVCTYGEPIYTNRQALLPRSPLVTKNRDASSEDEHFADVSGSDFDTKSFEELERLIALEESTDLDTITSFGSETQQSETLSAVSKGRVVVREIETVESATFTKMTKNEKIEKISNPQQVLNAPPKLKVLAMAEVKSTGWYKTQRAETYDGRDTSATPDSLSSAPSRENEGNEEKENACFGFVQNWDVSKHPLVVRRQKGLLNRDIELESLTSDAASDSNEQMVYISTPSGSIYDESDSSSISLADKPKMDFLKPGTYVNNDDSSVSDLFPDTDSETLDDDVFLSDSGYPEPDSNRDSWGELLTDTTSHVASFEAPNLLSDTQAENFLRHMLGIPDQACSQSAEASDSEQAELQEDLSACLSDVCHVVTSESESEAGEVLSEEVHTQEVTLVFAWPKDKSFVPSTSRNFAGKPYREIHVRKVTRVKDFDVEIMEGPKIVYTKKKALEDKGSSLLDNPEIMVTKPGDDSDQLDVTYESGIFSSQGDDTLQETPSDPLNLDDLLHNLSDISSDLDMTGEKSVQMHGASESWNIHAIPLVVPRPLSAPGSPVGVSSESGTKETLEHDGSGGEAVGGAALVEQREALHGTDVEHGHFSEQTHTHEHSAQNGDYVDSTAVVKDHNSLKTNKDDQHDNTTDKDDIRIENGDDKSGDKKSHARRTIIVTAVLRPKSELERQNLRPEDVCKVKHCDTCKSLVHVRKVDSKGQSSRSHLKCMKCSQMISERLVSRVTKTTSCKDISDSTSSMVYTTNTWPPNRDRNITYHTCAEHLKKLGRKFGHAKSDEETSSSSAELLDIEDDLGMINHTTVTEHTSNFWLNSTSILKNTPELSDDALLREIEAQLKESHLSIESVESEPTNPFDETSSSTDTVIAAKDATNIVTFQNPHPNPHGLRSPPPSVSDSGSSSKTDTRDPNGKPLNKEESIDSDSLDVIVEGYGSDTEELLSEIEYELNLQVPVPVLFDKIEDSSHYIDIIPDTPRAEGLEHSVYRSELTDFGKIEVYLPQKVVFLCSPDESVFLSAIEDVLTTDPTRSKVPNILANPPLVSEVEVKHRSAGFDTRELVCTVESATLTLEPYQEEIGLPEDINKMYPTVTTEAVVSMNRDTEIQERFPNNFKEIGISHYAGFLAEKILQDSLERFTFLNPVTKTKPKERLNYAIDTEVEPLDVPIVEATQNDTDYTDHLSMTAIYYNDILLEGIPPCLEYPILTATCDEPDSEFFSQFLHESKQYTSVIGVECIECGIVTNTVPKPTEATTTWQKTAKPLELPNPENEILILEDHFMSGFEAVESETRPDTSIHLSKVNVKIQTVEGVFLSGPASSHDHTGEADKIKGEQDTIECRETCTDVVVHEEGTNRRHEIEFKTKVAAIKEAIQAAHASKEKLNQPASEYNHKQGNVLVNTRSHKSMRIRTMATGLVESAFHEARSELQVKYQDQPYSTVTNSVVMDQQSKMGHGEIDTDYGSSNPGKLRMEWKTNQKPSEENKIWKGNPFIEHDENRVWKGNPVHDSGTDDRVIPILQRRLSIPVHQSDMVTPRETTNNVSIVDIGEVRSAGREDRALKSDAIAGARLLWKDYRASNRHWTQHLVPDYQETMDKIIIPRISQSTPELHKHDKEERDEAIEKIKEDIITVDAKGRFVIPARKKTPELEVIQETPREPATKKKKELSIRIPVKVIKEPTAISTNADNAVVSTLNSQQGPEQRLAATFKKTGDSKLPDVVGGVPKFTPYGGVRTFSFGKDDVDKDVHHHEELSRDGDLVRKSKLTTSTQHSGKHNECTFSTEGTISDIPIFGALFGGVQDGSRPRPDHQSIQSAFDHIFGVTEHPGMKQIESGSNLDWHKMQEERANIERVTLEDNEANKKAVKTLDFKVERSEETFGDVPQDLGIVRVTKPIHDISMQIARKEVGRSNRAIGFEKPAVPPRPARIRSQSPAIRRRREVPSPQSPQSPMSPKSPKSPRRRRRPVCPDHQKAFQDIYDINQEGEMRPRIDITSDTEIETDSQAQRFTTKEEAKTHVVEESRTSTQKTVPVEPVRSVRIPIHHPVLVKDEKETEKRPIPPKVPIRPERRKHLEKKQLTATTSNEDIEVRNIMESPKSSRRVLTEETTTSKKIVETRGDKIRHKQTAESSSASDPEWTRGQDDISSTHYVFPSEKNHDMVNRPTNRDQMVVKTQVEEFKREALGSQEPLIEVSKKYYKPGASINAVETEDEEVPDRQVSYDDVAGARLILKDRFGPSAFEVVKPQPSRKMAASSHDVSSKLFDAHHKNVSIPEKTLATSTPSVYKRKEFMSETTTREESKGFFDGMSKRFGDYPLAPSQIPNQVQSQAVPGHQYKNKNTFLVDGGHEDSAHQQRREFHETRRTTTDSCQIKVAKDNMIKVDNRGRFILPASMVSSIEKINVPPPPSARTTAMTAKHQLPTIETSFSESSPVLHQKTDHRISNFIHHHERRKSSSPVGFLKPGDSLDRDADVFHHGMSVSPSSPSFYRRTNQITDKKGEEDTTAPGREEFLKPRATEKTFSTSSPSIPNTIDDFGLGLFGRIGTKGLITQSEIQEMQQRIGMKRMTSSSEKHLSIPIRQVNHEDVSQSSRELGSIQTGPTGISFLDAMFAHRSTTSEESSAYESSGSEQPTGRYHDMDTSDDDQTASSRYGYGYSRSVDSLAFQHRQPQPEGPVAPQRSVPLGSFVAESEPNVSGGWSNPYSPRRSRKHTEYVVQKQFLDETVPYILGSDVIREQEGPTENETMNSSATFSESRSSFHQTQQQSHFQQVDRSQRSQIAGGKPVEYVMHCRSFYDPQPFISTEDVSLNVSDTDEAKMKKTLRVIKKKLPVIGNTLCDGRMDMREIEEESREMKHTNIHAQNKRHREEHENQASKSRKIVKDDCYQHFASKRTEIPATLSQSEQYISHEGQHMHHELDKEIRDLIGLSLPTLKQLQNKQGAVRCKVEETEIPEDMAFLTSVPGKKHEISPMDVETKHYLQNRRSAKPLTEYIIRRDGSPNFGQGLKSYDVMQRRATETEQVNIHQIARHVPEKSSEKKYQEKLSTRDDTAQRLSHRNTKTHSTNRQKHSFHIKDEKWDAEKKRIAGATDVSTKQCPPPSDPEHVAQLPVTCDAQFVVQSSPPVRKKEIQVGLNNTRRFQYRMPNTQEDMRRSMQYEQELNDSDEDEDNKSDMTGKPMSTVLSTGSTGTASDPYPGSLPRSFFGGPHVAISESSSETSDRDWDTFFRSLDAQNAQLYEVGGSNSDVSEDLDMILYGSYLTKSLVPGKFRSDSIDAKRKSLTRQGAVDQSSPITEFPHFKFDTKFPSVSEDEDFEKLFKKVEQEEYDNVPSTKNLEEYDNVPATQVRHTFNETKDTVEQSREMWNLRAMLAGQDRPAMSVSSSGIHVGQSRLGNAVLDQTQASPLAESSWHSSQGLPNKNNQIDRLNMIRGNVESLLAEVETLQSAIRASQEKRASSVVSDLPSYGQSHSSMEELRSTRAKSWDSSVADLNATEQLLQDIVAKVQNAGVSTTNQTRYQVQSGMQQRFRPEPDGSIPSSDLSSESDTQDPKREKTPKSILKVKTEKPVSHSGMVRFSEDQKQPQKPRRKQVSTLAAKTSLAGRSPPMVRKIIMDDKETHL